MTVRCKRRRNKNTNMLGMKFDSVFSVFGSEVKQKG
jgi:hypothetical protein